METFSRKTFVPFLILCCSFVPAHKADAQSNLSWSAAKQGAFVTALAQYGNRTFVATEDFGVWMWDSQSRRWSQFNAANSGIADDNIYALAVDKQGRVWAGTLRHGVSVYNGKTWRNYDVADGPLGERVFDIAVCPTDGNVWIATNAGLARYLTGKKAWRYYTRANGLPSDQIQTLAFDKEGNLFAGTQCDGLAMADAKDSYAKWRLAAAPSDQPGAEPQGKGLPSNLINDVLVARNGTIYVATTCGLAQSTDKGQTWSYTRGADYADKVRGRRLGLPYARWQPKAGAGLSEDYVTALAEDATGMLWVGHRQKAYEVFDPKTNQRVLDGSNKAFDVNSGKASGEYVTSILPIAGSAPLLGRYGIGLTTAPKPFGLPKASPSALSTLSNVAVDFPNPAEAPSATTLAAMLSNVRKLRAPSPNGSVAYLGEDWRTWGDWVGRYGRRYAILCATQSPASDEFISGSFYGADGDIGLHHRKGDVLRSFLAIIQTDNPKVLYDPILGYRREAEWDDHGETYPKTDQGPDIWVTINVPEGVHRATLYFYNKDAHEGDNRFRDYLLEVKNWNPRIDKAEASPTLAKARVRDFWGPVYKQFWVVGPNKYYIKIGKNNSHNTILQSVMLDSLTGKGPTTADILRSIRASGTVLPANATIASKPRSDPYHLDEMGEVQYNPPPLSDLPNLSVTQKIAADLWKQMDEAYLQQTGVALQNPYRLLAYRAVTKMAQSKDPSQTAALSNLTDNWRWRLKLWTAEDRTKFQEVMKAGYRSRLAQKKFREGKVPVTVPVGNGEFIEVWREPDAGMKDLFEFGKRQAEINKKKAQEMGKSKK